jgi:hypothetical protein
LGKAIQEVDIGSNFGCRSRQFNDSNEEESGTYLSI